MIFIFLFVLLPLMLIEDFAATITMILCIAGGFYLLTLAGNL